MPTIPNGDHEPTRPQPTTAEVRRASAVGHLQSAQAEIGKAQNDLARSGDHAAGLLADQGLARVTSALDVLGATT